MKLSVYIGGRWHDDCSKPTCAKFIEVTPRGWYFLWMDDHHPHKDVRVPDLLVRRDLEADEYLEALKTEARLSA